MHLKKTAIAILFTVSTGLSAGAGATENTTISLGFVNSHAKLKIDNLSRSDNLHGLNLKYRYEFNDRFGVVTSVLRSKVIYNIKNQGQKTGSADATYYSLTSGPSYRLNQYVSTYALAGIGHARFNGNIDPFHKTFTHNAFTAGTGFQFNITQNVSLDTHYEYAQFKNLKMNTFTAGVGYRF
ncbi:attachment invasion locus protein [Providencia alcalifaciens]|uniref:Attachment invasion locus protein n=1 Tax=Providencia alcalifaciens TaxID=126385 RepID=A0A4R3NCI3_9GAMM|nr:MULTISPECIES: Ail/Lom family outer membrane beta-barrel protein [Providencia]MBC5792249.1 outer membrane beta-barrel protein [Providencia sp. JUb39]TCT28136.1 attachment invasion locus protein [Providencia alcalifaciens]